MANKELWDFQVEDLSFYIAHPRCANLSDPGTGKTPSVCVYFQHLWEEKGCRSFWVMPKSLLEKNKDEILEFTDLKEDQVVIVDGTPKQRKKLMEKDAVVFLMGFRRFKDDWANMLELHPDIDALVVDEIHMGFGGHSSQQTAAMYASMQRLTYFLAMTGTLINGRLDSAYPTIHVIEPRYYSCYEGFLYTHAYLDDYGKPFAWRKHEKLSKIFQTHAIRRTFEEVHGAQDIVQIVDKVPMSKKQREVYEEWEGAALVELEDRFLDAATEGVHVIRARQIMEHPESVRLPILHDEDGKPIEWKEYNLVGKERNGKDERLLTYLADAKNTDSPLVIFGTFEKQIKRMAKLCEKEGFKVGYIHGGVSKKRRDEIDKQFRAGTLDVIIATPGTASVGYNWQFSGDREVDHVIFVSMDYMDGNFVQAVRRTIRGQREKVLRVTVMAYERCRIDNRIRNIVESKSADANKVDPTQVKVEFKKEKPKPKGKRKPEAVSGAPGMSMFA